MSVPLPVRVFSTLVAIAMAASALGAPDDNWPSWRGADGSGCAAPGAYPAKWTLSSGIAWKAPLPDKGCSTPVVWEGRIFLTAPVDGKDAALAFDMSGKPLWRQVFGPEQAGKHRNGSGSNPSAVTDGKMVFFFFKSGMLAACAMDGEVRWRKNVRERLGTGKLYWDYGSSPVLTETQVVVAMMHEGDAYLAAFDKKTGNVNWRVSRNYRTPVEGDHCYATPIVRRDGDRETLLVWGAQHLSSHDARDGRSLWSCGGFNPESKRNWVAVASAVVVGDVAVVPYGRGSRLHGIHIGSAGDPGDSRRLWKRQDTGAFVPTPAVSEGRVYLLRDEGQVECVEPTTGKTLWSGAFPKGPGKYYASPTIADGKLYAARENGVVFVARLAPGLEILNECDMGDRIIASPVPVANRILIRGQKRIYCIGPAGAEGPR